MPKLPQPIQPSTTIEFSLPRQQFVALKIYNLLGEEVATLLEKEVPVGTHKIDWSPEGWPAGYMCTGWKQGNSGKTANSSC